MAVFNARKTLQLDRPVEPNVYNVLARRGYFPERQKLLGNGIFGTRLSADIYISDAPAFPGGLVIETRWQHPDQADDEKLPYLVENLRHYPCPAIIIVESTPTREGALRWLRAQVAEVEQLLAVQSFAEFVRWCSNLEGLR